MPSNRFETAVNATMSLEMMPPSPDLNFLADNLLTPDDFNLGINFEVEVDPNEYLFGSDDDILQQISDDLEIPMSLEDDVMNLTDFTYHENKMNCAPDSSNSLGITYCTNVVKQEPLSPEHSPPSPHGSDSSIEAWQLQNAGANNEFRLLETPPITPQSSLDGSPPSTPTNGETSNAVQVLLQTIPAMHSSPPISLSNPLKSRSKSRRIVPANEKPQAKKIATSQVLVVTSEDYNKINTQSIAGLDTTLLSVSSSSENPLITSIKTEVPVNGLKPTVKFNQQTTPPLKPLISLPPQNVKQELDMNALKRQQRMIKNRESACLSRKKKKEYMASLESEVKDLNNANVRLQQENCQLKQIVARLEKENFELRKRFNVSNVKKTTAVLAVLFMLSLNVVPLREVFLSKESFPQPPNPLHHHSRSLLWSNSLNNDTNDSVIWDENHEINDDLINQAKNSSTKANCPVYINKTESQRLDSELRGWVFHLEKEDDIKKQTESKKKAVPPLPRLRGLIIPDSVKPKQLKHSDIPNNHDLQIFNLGSNSYDSFLEAIERRDDTFYVVSFSKDHLLLSARTHNKSRRPLMSLVLPAIPFNESDDQPLKDHVPMMQIDCEVTNTKLIQIKESLIRHNKDGGKNGTAFFESSDKTQRREMDKNATSSVKKKARKNPE